MDSSHIEDSLSIFGHMNMAYVPMCMINILETYHSCIFMIKLIKQFELSILHRALNIFNVHKTGVLIGLLI